MPKERASLDQISPVGEEHDLLSIPKIALMQTNPESQPAAADVRPSTSARGSEISEDPFFPSPGNQDSALTLALKNRQLHTKKPASFRLEDWVSDALHQRVHELQGKGYRITKEEIATTAIAQFLGITRPGLTSGQ